MLCPHKVEMANAGAIVSVLTTSNCSHVMHYWVQNGDNSVYFLKYLKVRFEILWKLSICPMLIKKKH